MGRVIGKRGRVGATPSAPSSGPLRVQGRRRGRRRVRRLIPLDAAELLEVGRVIDRAHGLRGEVVVDARSPTGVERARARIGSDTSTAPLDRAGRRARTRPLDRRPSRASPTANAAEALRGAVLRAEPLDDPDALWVHELIGRDVVERRRRAPGSGRRRSRPTRRSDLLVLDGGGLVPLRFVVERRRAEIVVDVPDGLL